MTVRYYCCKTSLNKRLRRACIFWEAIYITLKYFGLKGPCGSTCEQNYDTFTKKDMRVDFAFNFALLVKRTLRVDFSVNVMILITQGGPKGDPRGTQGEPKGNPRETQGRLRRPLEG